MNRISLSVGGKWWLSITLFEQWYVIPQPFAFEIFLLTMHDGQIAGTVFLPNELY